MSLGPALVSSGRAKHGIALMAEADDFSERDQFRFLWALLLAQYSRALLMMDDVVQSEAIARRAMRNASEAGETGNEAWACLAAKREMAPLLGLCRAALGS